MEILHRNTAVLVIVSAKDTQNLAASIELDEHALLKVLQKVGKRLIELMY
jgi:hypothetical protein